MQINVNSGINRIKTNQIRNNRPCLYSNHAVAFVFTKLGDIIKIIYRVGTYIKKYFIL